MMPRVMLDTNVILTGSLLANSYARQLLRQQEKFSFIVPKFVISEAKKVVRINTLNQKKIIAADNLIDFYLKHLNVIVLNELELNGNVDSLITNSALVHDCQYICTYNIKDFLSGKIKAVSPLTLIKEHCGNNVDKFLPFFLFGEEGTVLFNGILTHRSSLGELFTTGNGIKVFVDEKGAFQASGGVVKSIRNQMSLPDKPQQHLFLIVRYNKKFFEAKYWDYDLKQWHVLCEGAAEFQLPIQPTLGTTGKLNAVIYDFSAIPRFLRGKQLTTIIESGCLESAVGSADIRFLLARLQIEEVAPGEWKITF